MTDYINNPELNSTENNNLGATFQRCPHDSDHPYSIISNNLIRDSSISPNCRWLIIYLLSNKPGWNIKMSQVINHLKGQMGRQAFYTVLKESLESGYIKCEYYFEKNLRRCSYFVSETPKFKKILPRDENRKVDNTTSEKRHDKEDYKKNDYKKNPPPPSSKDIPKKEKPKVEAYRISEKGRESLRSEEEEDFSCIEKKKLVESLPFTDKEKKRLIRVYGYEELKIAIEIFYTHESKKDPFAMILHILNYPDNWDKKKKVKTQEDIDKEKEDYSKKNKEIAEKHEEMYKKNIKICGDYVKVRTHRGEFQLFFWEKDFERCFHSLLNKID